MRNAEQAETHHVYRCAEDGDTTEPGSEAAVQPKRRAVLVGAVKSVAYFAPATLAIMAVEARASS